MFLQSHHCIIDSHITYDTLSGTVTNQAFEKIAKNIGADWHRLGILLGLSHTDLDHLKENYPHSVIDCIMAMLEQWRGDPVTDGSMAVVRTALVDVGRRDLAEFIATHDNGKLFNKTRLLCVCLGSKWIPHCLGSKWIPHCLGSKWTPHCLGSK